MLVDYQGQYSGPHFWQAGQVVEVDEPIAARLVQDGRAAWAEDDAPVPIAPAPEPIQTPAPAKRGRPKKESTP